MKKRHYIFIFLQELKPSFCRIFVESTDVGRRRKSYKQRQRIYWASGIAAFVFVAYLAFLWTSTRSEKEPFVEYNGFGIPLPAEFSIHGIDVSRYQKRISWSAVKQMEVGPYKIGFAIIKATEGADLKDPLFERNWKNARKAGVVRGAYHFFNPKKKIEPQVRNLMRTVKLQSGDLPPVLDVEKTGGLKEAIFRRQVKSMLLAMEAAYGVKPIIYTYVSFYERYLGGDFDDYPLWVAHYEQPEKPRIDREWTFWQHHDGGKVNGILAPVDFNVFNGDSLQFYQLLIP